MRSFANTGSDSLAQDFGVSLGREGILGVQDGVWRKPMAKGQWARGLAHGPGIPLGLCAGTWDPPQGPEVLCAPAHKHADRREGGWGGDDGRVHPVVA